MREMNEKLRLCRGTRKYDEQLMKICLSTEPQPFFGVLHPELLPYVGQNYEKTGVLLVGESHYVKEATWEEWESTNWYHAPLPSDGVYPFNSGNGAKDWFDTREVLVRYMNGCKGKGHTIFSRPVKVLHDLGMGTGDIDHDFDYFAFMNFFQRPSLKKGETIDDMDDDKPAAKRDSPSGDSHFTAKSCYFPFKKSVQGIRIETVAGNTDRSGFPSHLPMVEQKAAGWRLCKR